MMLPGRGAIPQPVQESAYARRVPDAVEERPAPVQAAALRMAAGFDDTVNRTASYFGVKTELRAQLVDMDGTPVPGAQFVVAALGYEMRVTSDRQGHVRLVSYLIGDSDVWVDLSAKGPGHRHWFDSISIDRGETLDIDTDGVRVTGCASRGVAHCAFSAIHGLA